MTHVRDLLLAGIGAATCIACLDQGLVLLATLARDWSGR